MTVNSTMTRATRLATRIARRILVGRVPKLFDHQYYLRNNPDLAISGMDPYLHYVWFGASRGRDPAEDFDTEFYRGQSGPTRLDPIRHYIRQGVKTGLDPSRNFSTRAYLMRYPDVVAIGANPLLHYRNHGRHEGREALPITDSLDQIVPIRGVRSEHVLSFPAEDANPFEIHLRADLPAQREAVHVKRLCFLLKLTNDEIVLVLDAFQTAGSDRQTSIVLEMATGAEPRPSMNTLLIAFEHCYTTRPNDKGSVRLRYGEVRLWDLRNPTPSVIEIFGPGAAEFCSSSGAGSSA